mgnify:CR=1 FL=1
MLIVKIKTAKCSIIRFDRGIFFESIVKPSLPPACRKKMQYCILFTFVEKLSNFHKTSFTLKKTNIFRITALLSIITFFGLTVNGQISKEGNMTSQKYQIENDNFPQINVNPPDVRALQEEDEWNDKYGLPYRFSVSTPVEINFCKEGNWTSLPGGGKMCRLAIKSPDAEALIVYYKNFRIPAGGELYVSNASRKQKIGAFTSFNNRDGGGFANEMIEGEVAVLEYFQPYGIKEQPEIVISEIGHVYRASGFMKQTRGFGGSDTCEVNINCPEGDNWQQQKRAVARIIVKQGSQQVWCTGTLMNNAHQDGTPWFITADHCGASSSPADYNQWIFYFRYEGPECQDPLSDTAFKNYTMVGATKKAAAGGAGYLSDFKLLLLNESVPENYNPFFAGWNISNEPDSLGVTIHHPQGDVKKISTYVTPLVSTNWSGTPNTHWRVVWAHTETNWGVTEGGSSGSPLFNQFGQWIGQLTGGDASCNNLTGPDYYGKSWYSWNQSGTADSTRLQPWLDPDNSGITLLNGTSNVGIGDESRHDFEIVAFPNPTEGPFFVDLTGFKPNTCTVKIFSVLGDLVSYVIVNQPDARIVAFDLSSQKPGVYFIHIDIAGNPYYSKIILR